MPKNNLTFCLEVFSIHRDFSQGLYANRIPLNDPLALKIFRLLNELVQYNTAKFKAGKGEIGGADPQVSAVFRNADYMETYRQIRQIAQYIVLRALWRGINGFLLEPSNEADLRHVLTQLAQDVADSDLSTEQQEELLRIKIFDSQGNMDEVQSTINILKDLRDQGYPVTAEIAIPYSSGAIYTDEMYVSKALEAAYRLQDAGIPLETCRISLKDMVGELDAATAKRVLGKIVQEFRDKGLPAPLGLHLHDTGLATKAYAEAIKTSIALDYPITIDTVECDTIDPAHTGQDAWKNTGFASLLAIDELLKEQGIDLEIPAEQIAIFKEIGKCTKELAQKYEVRRVDSALSGEALRQFHIPGGGFASYSNAVKAIGLLKKLNPKFTESDALYIGGHALIAVGKLMGEPFAVTPGFQNKQIAALNLLQNLIDAKILTSSMSYDEIVAILAQPLDDRAVETLFLHKLSPVVKEFLRGEMPGEVHPVIRRILGKRTESLAKTIPSKLDHARRVVTSLLDKGQIKATHTQAFAILKKLKFSEEMQVELNDLLVKNNITYAAPDGSMGRWQFLAYEVLYQYFIQKNYDVYLSGDLANTIIAALEEKAIQTNITWALELGNPEKLIDAVEKHWLREPDPSKKEGYKEALENFQRGKNPLPDELRQLYKEVDRGNIPLKDVYEYSQEILKKEYEDIKTSVLAFIHNKTDPVEKIIADLFAAQKEIIIKKERTGTYFLLTEKVRLDYAKHCLKSFVRFVHPTNIIDTTWHEIESNQISAPMGGLVVSITNKKEVKKGDVIAVIEAAKMENAILAPKDGLIDIKVDARTSISRSDLLACYQKPALEENASKVQSPAINCGSRASELAESETKAKELADSIAQKQQQIKTHLLMEHLQKCGFYGQPLSLSELAKTGHENEIHVIDNRAGCATKLYADLKQAGYTVRVLCAPGDETTTLIANALPGEVIPISHYNNEEAVLNALEKLARENKGKKIYLHPGWGFLSENDEFVAKMEQLGQRYNVVFVGPSSNPMLIAGGKKTLRDLVEQIDPECNPKYFGCNDKRYVSLAAQFAQIKQMGGDVMIKAVKGGGGRGIAPFKIDPKLSDAQNYHQFVATVQENKEKSKKLFNDDEYLVEQCIRGTTRHLEVQFATTKKGGQILGLRDCTAQNNSQKIIETNIIKGDYPQPVIDKIITASKKLAKKLSEIGYEGVGTLEMLILPDGNFKFLEVNTRVQVEHMVTEDDVSVKCGKHISMPLINLLCKQYPNELPETILKRYFNLTDADLMAMMFPGTQRITHFRLNSRDVDLSSGKSVISYFYDWMLNLRHTFKSMFNHFKSRMVIGGLGKGEFDPQVGALCGKEADALKAAQAMRELVETSRACHRNDGKLSIDFVLEFYKLMYNENGNFNPNISTKTVDEFLKAIEQGKIVLEMDHESHSIEPRLKEGAMQCGFEQLLKLQQSAVETPTKTVIAAM